MACIKTHKNKHGFLVFVLIQSIFSFLIFAGGVPDADTEIVLLRPPVHINPQHSIKDHAVLKIDSVKLSIPDNTTITEYELRVYNKNGEIIYSTYSENTNEYEPSTENILPVPETLFWNGNDVHGTILPDGEYFYQVYVRDSYNRKSSTAPLAVIIDTIPPEIKNIHTDIEVFSPESDNTHDVITFHIESGLAEKWEAKIQNIFNTTVWNKSFTPEDSVAVNNVSSPLQITWDGRDTSRIFADDGAYNFILKGTDRAGNVTEESLNFMINNASHIELGIEGGNPYFSHKVRKEMVFTISIAELENINKWILEIQDENGMVFKRFGKNTAPPERIIFNGKGNEENPENNLVPLIDGKYKAIFSAFYNNGNVSVSDPLPFIMDSTPPSSYLVADSAPIKREIGNAIYFGGSSKPYMFFNGEFEENIHWDIVILHKEEEIIVPLHEFLDAGFSLPFNWDGSSPFTSEIMPDGAYQIFLRAYDKAGNEGISSIARFIKDTETRENTSISLSMIGNKLRIRPIVPVVHGIEHFIVRVVNREDDSTYFARRVRKVLPYIDWAGKQNNDDPVPFGNYRVELDIKYLNGDRIRRYSTPSVIVKNTGITLEGYVSIDGPKGKVIVNDTLFSPDNDGVNDTVRIGLRTDDTSIISSWIVEILDPYGNIFRKWQGGGRPPKEIIWDGSGNNGKELVQSAANYTIVLSLDDESGNRGLATNIIKVDILVIVDGDQLKINIPSIYFAPNTSDLFDVAIEEQQRNLLTLHRLSEILNTYEEYSITIEGHAVQILSGTAGNREQVNTLIPLSRNRAFEVKKALAILGVTWERMTVKGIGGERPIVPHSDRKNRWKNRRVEFILN